MRPPSLLRGAHTRRSQKSVMWPPYMISPKMYRMSSVALFVRFVIICELFVVLRFFFVLPHGSSSVYVYFCTSVIVVTLSCVVCFHAV